MTGRLDDAHDVFEDVVVDVDALSDAAQREDVIAGEHGGDGLRAVADVDLRYPEDGGSRCMITRLSSKNSDTIFIKRAAEAMMSPEDFEEMEAAVDWLIDEDAEKEEE